ncbi:MAG: hypothetical protein ACK518_04495 [bacterium]|jgi:hypothetical protein
MFIADKTKKKCLVACDEQTKKDGRCTCLSKSADTKQLLQTDVSGGMDDKGVLNGKCNITSCQKPNSATWYNHSTQKYYCESCANRLNNDEFNKRDAMRLFGHDLCTKAV